MKKAILSISMVIFSLLINGLLWGEQETYVSKTLATIPWGDSEGQVPLYEEKVEMNDGTTKINRYALLYDIKTDSQENIYLLIRSERVDKYSPEGIYINTIKMLIDESSIIVKIVLDKKDNLYAYIEDKEKSNKHPYKSKIVKMDGNGKNLYEYSFPPERTNFYGDLRVIDDEIIVGDKKVSGIGPNAKILKANVQKSRRPEEIMSIKGSKYEVHPKDWADKEKGILIKDTNNNIIHKFEVAQPQNIERIPDVINLLKVDKNGNIFIAPGFYTTAIKPDPREQLEIQKYDESGELLARILLPKKNEWNAVTGILWPPYIDDDGDVYYYNASESGVKIVKLFIQK